MSRARSSSDNVVARGRIRVDARRAVEKLREHLLVDLHLYTLEIARAAAAGGATWVEIGHDADEVSLTFDGEPLDEATMVRLLDHVLADATDAAARRIRLLAMGVNAALGLAPAHVDIFSRGEKAGEGGALDAGGKKKTAAEACLRVRWTPALLKVNEGDDGAAKAPKCEIVAPPPGMPERGVRVAVRRKLGWSVVKQAIGREVPREISLLAGATGSLPIPLTIGGRPLDRESRASALVRAGFDVRGARRGVLEIVPAPGHPQAEFLEHGVRLVRYAWSFEPEFPSAASGDAALPVRVIVDAEELPTNASRSEVRSDAPLLGLVKSASFPAFTDALRALIARATGEGDVPPGVEVSEAPVEAFEDALGAIAAVVVQSLAAGAKTSSLPSIAEDVQRAKFLRNAHGEPISPDDVLAQAEPLHVWRGKSPLPEELSLWTRRVVWDRGRLADKVLASFQCVDAKEIIEEAKAGAKRRKSLLSHAASEPVLPPLSGEVLREFFHVRQGDLNGLNGEYAVMPGARDSLGTQVRTFVEGRLIETVEIDTEKLPLSLEIALAWEGKLRPKPTYEGVEQDESFRIAVWHVAKMAVRALDRAASKLGSDPDADSRLRAALRAAVGAHLLATEGLGIPFRPIAPFSSMQGLFDAPIWATTEPGRRESLRTLRAISAGSGAVCVAKAGAQGRAVDGRPVVTGRKRELRWLAAALAPSALSPYDGMLVSDQELAARDEQRARSLELTLQAQGVEPGPTLEVARAGVLGLLAPAPSSRLVLLHAGRPVPAVAFTASLGEVLVVLDDDSVVCKSDWTGLHRADSIVTIPAMERDLCESIVSALEGNANSSRLLRHGIPADPGRLSPMLRAYLITSAHALRKADGKPDQKAELDALAERIERLPFLFELDEGGSMVPTSLASISKTHPPPTPIPCLTGPPGFETFDWRPVVLPREGPEVEAFGRWAEGRLLQSDAALPARYAAAMAQREKRLFLSKEELDPRAVGDLADPDGPVVFLSSSAASGGLPAKRKSPDDADITVAAGLPREYFNAAGGAQIQILKAAEIDHAWVDILFQRRHVCRRAMTSIRLPVVARVGLADEIHIDQWQDLSLLAVMLVSDHVHAAALMLAKELIARPGGPQGSSFIFGERRALRLIRALLHAATIDASWIKGNELIADLRADSLLWPTVQGSAAPLSALYRAGSEIYFGRASHPLWVGPSRGRTELDKPILYAPLFEGDGDLILSILSFLSFAGRDVTESVGKLQARRAATRPAEAPVIPGAPAHPSLRLSLAEGRVTLAEGELEIIQGPEPDIRFIGIDGVPRPINVDLPFPLRILARVDTLDVTADSAAAAIKEINRAAIRHILGLHKDLAELPIFVRHHLRTVLLRIVSQDGKLSTRQKAAPIFIDTEGAWRSYDELRKDPTEDWRFTSAPPPYPARKPQKPVLVLTEKEATWLKTHVRLFDVTSHLRREIEAEMRSTGPQAPSIELDPEVRAACLRVFTIDEDGMKGEIGVLAPEAAARRKIGVFVTRRKLCEIDDGPGIPLAVAVNDDAIKPNRWFDGVRSHGIVETIQTKIRAIADRALRAWLAPPTSAVAVRWRDLEPSPDKAAELVVYGSFWLPAEWPLHQPFVRVRTSASGAPLMQPFTAPGDARHIRREIPVCADLVAAPDISWSALSSLAMREAEALIAQATKDKQAAPSVALYAWNMGLLGSLLVTPPERSADGRALSRTEIVTELAARGQLWITRREGSIEGAFPENAPSFVLLDTKSPLLEVLRHRAAPGVVRELGGFAPVRPSPGLPIAPASLDPEEFDRPSIVDFSGAGSWVERLRSRLALLWSAQQASPAPPPSPLCTALQQGLDELRLVGDPVADIVEVKSGRPIRYEAKKKRLLVHRAHPSLAWLGEAGTWSPDAIALVLSAAVTEVNRALEAVNDAEERRVLLKLLHAAMETSS
ncbi:MAG: hypothetical protein HUU21_05440 [Polyangiaceae bacterium]|nr:hypothetical protein [Polyangiaceae bacterium]